MQDNDFSVKKNNNYFCRRSWKLQTMVCKYEYMWQIHISPSQVLTRERLIKVFTERFPLFIQGKFIICNKT